MQSDERRVRNEEDTVLLSSVGWAKTGAVPRGSDTTDHMVTPLLYMSKIVQ